MKNEEFKRVVAQNLVYFRKKKGLTQQELAQQLNYSDKAISKWERGESLPDTFVLYTICEYYHIGLDDLLVKKRREPKVYSDRAKLLITMMGVGLVWVIATLLFMLFSWTLKSWHESWLVFIYAIPLSALVLLIFAYIWGRNWMQVGSASMILWGISLSFFLTIIFTPVNKNPWWLIFVLALTIQIVILLWYYFRYVKKRQKKLDTTTENK